MNLKLGMNVSTAKLFEMNRVILLLSNGCYGIQENMVFGVTMETVSKWKKCPTHFEGFDARNIPAKF